MAGKGYTRILSNPRARTLLLLGFFLRVPTFGVGVVLTLHVVQTLHRSWAQAGVVTAVATIALAISGPWRGKKLDDIGLRRVVLPSIAVTGVCWALAPFQGYFVLLGLAALAGLFAVPTFTVVRQGLVAQTSDDDRRAALALDGIIVEFAFMLGPVVAIALSSAMSTRWVIFGLQMVATLMALVLWAVDPPIRAAIAEEEAGDVTLPRRAWVTLRFLAVCMVAFAAVVVLSGSDVTFVAATEAFHSSSQLGYVLAIWGFGSVVGGLVYGAMAKPPPMFLLLLLLAVTTIPMGFAHGMVSLSLWSLVAGLFCAPTLTASIDALTRVVPERVRGEAMGWHGSFLTLGGALGGPVAGWFIDVRGWPAGFISVGVLGGVLAGAGAVLITLRRKVSARKPN